MSKKVVREIKLREIIGSIAQLRALADKSFKVDVSYKLAHSMRLLDVEVAAYNETLNKVREKYADRVDGAMKWQSKTAEQEFVNEANELLSQIVEIDVYPIDINELTGDVSPKMLIDCWFLFSDFDEDGEGDKEFSYFKELERTAALQLMDDSRTKVEVEVLT